MGWREGCNAAALIQFCGAAIVLLFAPIASAQTTFTDGTFPDGAWGVDVRYAGGSGSASGGHQFNGGDPTDYFQLTISTSAGPSGILAFVQNGSFTYTPSTQGAINSLAFSFSVESQAGIGTAFVNLALEQNSQIYLGPEYDTSSTSWIDFSDSLSASNFSLVTAAGNGEFSLDTTSHPDFSASGAAILFGFSSLFNSDPGGPSGSETAGVDNYRVVLNPVAVPEPTTIVFLVGGLAVLAVARRRGR